MPTGRRRDGSAKARASRQGPPQRGDRAGSRRRLDSTDRPQQFGRRARSAAAPRPVTRDLPGLMQSGSPPMAHGASGLCARAVDVADASDQAADRRRAWRQRHVSAPSTACAPGGRPLPQGRRRPRHRAQGERGAAGHERGRQPARGLQPLPAWVHEVVLVDGRSTDGTIDVARELWPDVRVVHQGGVGKGTR